MPFLCGGRLPAAPSHRNRDTSRAPGTRRIWRLQAVEPIPPALLVLGPPASSSPSPERSAKGSGNHALRPSLHDDKGGAMESKNVKTYRAGHEAFNRRDFDAMVKEYAESISWIDRARGITFRTPQEFKRQLPGGMDRGLIRLPGHRRPVHGRRRHGGRAVYLPGHARRPARALPCDRQGVDAASLRDVAFRRRRSSRRRRDLLRPGLPAHAAGPDAGAVPGMRRTSCRE